MEERSVRHKKTRVPEHITNIVDPIAGEQHEYGRTKALLLDANDKHGALKEDIPTPPPEMLDEKEEEDI